MGEDLYTKLQKPWKQIVHHIPCLNKKLASPQALSILTLFCIKPQTRLESRAESTVLVFADLI